MKRHLIISIFFFLLSSFIWAQQFPFQNSKLSIDERVSDLISRLTLEEKAAQMLMNTPAIPRLGIPEYEWWNEALHGVGRAGKATIFPQAIGLGATFDSDLALRVATAISDEARAKFNEAQKIQNYGRYSGLTFWTPNVNIFRDPRWGRGQETYGEDPYLTSLLGTAFVRGLQGDHPKYLKTAACAKHFAVHSGPEKLRHEFDAVASPKDMNETYLPAFKALVDAGVESIMCAYNKTNGEPCCAHKYLLEEVLLKEWQFKGHVLSDCWAIKDFYNTPGHGASKNKKEAAALAVKSGVSLNCGDTYEVLAQAVKDGLVSEKVVDEKLAILLRTRFRLGLFDPEDLNPYSKIGYEVVDSEKHRALAYEVATKSAVLLKNNGVLPLKNDLSKYFVLGPNAASMQILMGNYYGTNPNMVTVLEGITDRVSPGSAIEYSLGTTIDRNNINPIDWTTIIADMFDVCIVVMGLDGTIEGEEGESISSPHFGDRLDYDIPANQITFLKKLRSETKKPIIAVVTGGCPMNLQDVEGIADAILFAWYPGEEGGHAIADIIFGNVSPSGKLPLTFPKSLDQLPPYDDYNMKGRTYKYMEAEPQYPFGFGLSYANFQYNFIKASKTSWKKGEEVEITCTITNTSGIAAEEVAQLYVSNLESSELVPIFDLKRVKRIKLGPNQEKVLRFKLSSDDLTFVNSKGQTVLEKGQFKISIGGSLPGKRSEELGLNKAQELVIKLK